jgi:hypothetical protein
VATRRIRSASAGVSSIVVPATIVGGAGNSDAGNARRSASVDGRLEVELEVTAGEPESVVLEGDPDAAHAGQRAGTADRGHDAGETVEQSLAVDGRVGDQRTGTRGSSSCVGHG